MPELIARFAERLIAWQKGHGRQGLPWQGTRDAYRIWLSEIMLQQTQVATVIGYYERFLARFPDVEALATASEDDVLTLWSGLGYYSRARNLHAAAKAVVGQHGGRFPRTAAELAELPGVGRSTAAAIAAFAFGERAAILDGNVKRVLVRAFGIDAPMSSALEKQLWAQAQSLLPVDGIEAYTQGLMDLGATVCTPRKPRCQACPYAADCVAHRDGLAESLPRKAAKAKAERVRRECSMLVLCSDDRVLLVRRPPAGIWASLWCYPEYNDNPRNVFLEKGHELIGVLKELPALKHSFTHFDLTVHPLLGRVRATPHGVREDGERWVRPSEFGELGVPAIVGKLWRAVQAHNSAP